MKLEKLLNKFKKKLGKPMKNNQKPERELNLIIGFGQIGSSIYDRFKYLKNNEDSKNNVMINNSAAVVSLVARDC